MFPFIYVSLALLVYLVLTVVHLNNRIAEVNRERSSAIVTFTDFAYSDISPSTLSNLRAKYTNKLVTSGCAKDVAETLSLVKMSYLMREKPYLIEGFNLLGELRV